MANYSKVSFVAHHQPQNQAMFSHMHFLSCSPCLVGIEGMAWHSWPKLIRPGWPATTSQLELVLYIDFIGCTLALTRMLSMFRTKHGMEIKELGPLFW